jgi:hypothetical protein
MLYVSCSKSDLRLLAHITIAKMNWCTWARSRSRASRSPTCRRPGKWRTRTTSRPHVRRVLFRTPILRARGPCPHCTRPCPRVAAASPALSFLCQEPAGSRWTTAIRSVVGPEVAPAGSDDATWHAGVVGRPVRLDLVHLLRVGEVDAAVGSIALPDLLLLPAQARWPGLRHKLGQQLAPSRPTPVSYMALLINRC